MVVGESTNDEKPLLGVVEGVDCLLETETVLAVVVVLLLFVVNVAVSVSDVVVAVVLAIAMAFELTLCDLTGGFRGDGGTCATLGITQAMLWHNLLQEELIQTVIRSCLFFSLQTTPNSKIA